MYQTCFTFGSALDGESAPLTSGFLVEASAREADVVTDRASELVTRTVSAMRDLRRSALSMLLKWFMIVVMDADNSCDMSRSEIAR